MRMGVRRGRTAAAIAALLCACSAGSPRSHSTTQISVSVALPALVITRVPPGLVVQPESVARTGAIDQARLAAEDGNPDAATALSGDGYVGGFERLWRSADGRQLLVGVYQFRGAAGAAAWMARTLAIALQPVDGATPRQVGRVPGVPDSMEIGVAGTAAARVLLRHNAYVAVVSLAGGAGVAGDARALAQEEARLLP